MGTSLRESLSPEFLRTVLHYDPETGKFTWIALPSRKASGKVKPGQEAGCRDDCDGYVRLAIKGRHYLAHRLAWLYVHGKWPEHNVDHINGVRSDNRIANLRDVPQTINAQNRRKATRGASLMGVDRRPSGRYRAIVCSNYALKHLGTFDTAEEAHAAYLAAKRALHPGCSI